MKKIFTYSVAATLLGLALPAFAEDAAPCLTMTVGRDAVEENFCFQISAEDGATIQVDWGDGTLKNYDIVNYDDQGFVFSEIKGIIAGTQIKVYAPDPTKINYLTASKDLSDGENAFIRAIDLSKLPAIKELDLASNQIANLDLSALVAMTNLSATNNQLTTLVLPASEALKSIDISNTLNTATGELTETAGNNQVLATDWSKAPNLITLKVNGNSYKELGWFDDFDISGNTKISTLEINGCLIPSLDLTHLTGLKTLRAQWNEFTTIDLSKMVYTNATVFLTHNYLKSFKLPEGATGMTTLNVAYNALTFATLPAPGITKNANNYVYDNQENLIISLSSENIVDFSSQAKVGDKLSKFVWTATLDGETEPSELSADKAQYNETEPGVFRFNVPVKDLSAQISNEAFPKLTLGTTTATSIGLLPEILTLEVNRSETADGIFLGFIDSEGQNVYIDWGDGQYAGPYTIEKNGYDYPTTMPCVKLAESWDDNDVAAPLKGNTIKVKGNPETIVTVEAKAKADWTTGEATTATIKSIDLSKLTGLLKVALDNNVLTTIDLSKNPLLKYVSVKGNKLTSFDFSLAELSTLNIGNEISSGKIYYGENKIPTLDFEKLPELVELTSDGNGLNTDFSKAQKLARVSMQVNELTEFAPVSSTLERLSMHYSTKLTSFDASGITSNANVFLINSALGETKECLKLSPTINNLNISSSKFTFATLPAVKSVQGTLTYSPQSAMVVKAEGAVVDLSSQAMVENTATVFAWTAGADNTEFTDFTNGSAAGVFTFAKDAENAVCTMTNEAYPNLTLKTAPVEIKVSGVAEIEAAEAGEAVYFNLQGVKVDGTTPGIYIRVLNGKSQKVIIK